MLSVVIPVYNEEKNVSKLYQELFLVLGKLNEQYEIIFVNDGSVDGTLEELKKLPKIKIISFTRNFGQTPAFDAGFKAAKGEVVITMDGDLQNDPADIPEMLRVLRDGKNDAVCGWRQPRSDSGSKIFVSFTARILRRILLGDKLHDAGCSLRVYRKECLDGLDLYSEMHRFIPSILAARGYKVIEIKTHHRPRVSGRTKYNWIRGVRGLTDMAVVWFWQKYQSRPIHLFGGGGLFMFFIGFVMAAYFFVIRVFFDVPLAGRILPIIPIFLMLFGVQLFVTGLLADIAIRNYYVVSKKQNYIVREIAENR